MSSSMLQLALHSQHKIERQRNSYFAYHYKEKIKTIKWIQIKPKQRYKYNILAFIFLIIKIETTQMNVIDMTFIMIKGTPWLRLSI